MTANADIFEYKEPWGGPFGLSVALHVALFGGMLLYGALHGRGESWGGTGGGGGDAMSARLVSTIPLPAKQGENVLATESKGLTQSKPKEVI